MGGVWNNDKSDGYVSSSAGDASDFYGSSNATGAGATRTVVKSHCRTEEVQPGKYIRKCERTEETFKQCLGRPDEVVRSIKEYTEEDVTHQMFKGPFSSHSSESGSSYFPGLRNDIEAIERDIFGGINSFFEAAEDIKNEIFGALHVPRLFEKDSSSSSSRNKLEFHVEGPVYEEASPKKKANGENNLSGLARDV